MQRGARRLPGVLLATALTALLAAAPAHAEIAWAPCHDTNDFACGQLTVPVDHFGNAPETIALTMRRHLAPVGGAKDAVIALAGGPGQAAIPFTEQFNNLLGPIDSANDLIVLDQRGTGRSHSLSCAAFERLHGRQASPAAIGVCGDQLGSATAFYRTADTVADLEAIRQAGGYEKLILYGTSYGTKVAERYAQTYPSHVAALVLDSVVPPNGPDPASLSGFAAVRRILATLCAGRACKGITDHPVADLAQIVRRMRQHGGITVRAIDGKGKAHVGRVAPEDLLNVLYAGDFDRFSRAEFPAAIRSADLGDTAALGRMLVRAESSDEEGPESLTEGFDVPLFYATTCEEEAFPWSRASSPAQRMREALAYLHRQPASAFFPFTADDALDTGGLESCSHWPFASSGPEVDEAPLPAVPTLILSGAADLRTPTANALELAQEIPGAQLLIVPNTGHSVLSAAFDECARKALQVFFAGQRISPCRRAQIPPVPPPMPVAPRRLGAVHSAVANHGLPGKALEAVILSVEDFERESELKFAGQIGEREFLSLLELRVGGLRGGWAKLSDKALTFHRYTYVPGVSLSGRIGQGKGTLRIAGIRAIRGTLRLTRRDRLAGMLGATRVHTVRAVFTG